MQRPYIYRFFKLFDDGKLTVYVYTVCKGEQDESH